MNFQATTIPGVFLIEPERLADERGFFARTWCHRQAAELGLDDAWIQSSISLSHRRGTLRGMHYQMAPHEETKLIRCTRGVVYDVLLDLRPRSASFGHWESFELSAQNHRQLYVPPGIAHGFLTLTDECEMSYHMTTEHSASAARGVRYDDPAFQIEWPEPIQLLSKRDLNWSLFSEASIHPQGIPVSA